MAPDLGFLLGRPAAGIRPQVVFQHHFQLCFLAHPEATVVDIVQIIKLSERDIRSGFGRVPTHGGAIDGIIEAGQACEGGFEGEGAGYIDGMLVDGCWEWKGSGKRSEVLI